MKYLRVLFGVFKDPLVFLLSALILLPLVMIPAGTLAQGTTRGGQSATTTKGEIELEIARTVEANTISAPKYAFDNLQYLIGGVTTLAIGPSTDTAQGAAAAEYFGPNAVSTLGQGIAFMIGNPPASSEYYVADLLRQTPFVPQAYAQGIGFSALDPVLGAWKVVRDVAYVFFVLVFLVIGFLIMFRQKLGGQVVTAVSAIPNLIITLLLITFSYAIAGLLIDVMYLLVYFVIAIFTPLVGEITGPSIVPGIPGGPITLEQMAFGNNIFFNGLQMVFGAQSDANGSVAGSAAHAIGNVVASFFPEGPGGFAGAIGQVFGGGVALIAYLVFAIAILFAVFKTFFQLLMSYAMFLISVITAPVQLLAASFGSNGGFVQWLRNLAGHLAPFPTVIILLILAMSFAAIPTGGGGFMPPQITIFDPDVASGEISALIALGILMLIPEAVKMSKEIVGAKDDFFGKYMKDITNNIVAGYPIGGRVGMGGMGAALGTLPTAGFAANEARKTPGGIGRKVNVGLKAFSTIAQDPNMPIRRLTSLGVSTAAKSQRNLGIRQPDIANPITEQIDKRFLTEKEQKKQSQMQFYEDLFDARDRYKK